VMIRDCGVGLGVFIMKKKLFLKRMQPFFLSVGEYFIHITLGMNKLTWKIFDLLGQ